MITKLCRAMSEAVACVMNAAAGLKKAKSALICCVQTFGERLNPHIHLHVLSAEGVFKDGSFYPVFLGPHELHVLEQVFAQWIVPGSWESELCESGDGGLLIDNNAAERALRGPVVGRKNHYGSKSLRGTQVAALFYTLCESAKLVGVDPHTYLLTATEAALAVPGTVTLPAAVTA